MSSLNRRVITLLIAFAGTACLGGCSTLEEVGGKVATNLKSRVLDLADPVTMGVGMGMGASVRATNYAQGGMLFTLAKNSFRGRDVQSPINFAPEMGISPLFHVRSIADPETGFDGRAVVAGKTLVDANEESWSSWAVDERWQWFPSRSDYAANYDRHLWDIGVSVYGVVGLDVAINLVETPLELVDFLVGVVTIGLYDPAGDDHRWEGPRLLDTVAAQ